MGHLKRGSRDVLIHVPIIKSITMAHLSERQSKQILYFKGKRLDYIGRWLYMKMKFPELFDRAYINIDREYDLPCECCNNLNVMDLIHAVAKVNSCVNGKLLFDESTQKIYEGRTKKFIVEKTREYIYGISEQFSIDENMANFVSLRQLKYLIKAFDSDKKRISCYGLVFFYVIFVLLKDKTPMANDCKVYLNALHNIVYCYFENNPEDQLAIFFHGCFNPIYTAIESENTALMNSQLPPVPRSYPKEEFN